MMTLLTQNPILDAPCIFCHYKGQGYWQARTHETDCPWYEVGGYAERDLTFRGEVRTLYRRAAATDRNWAERIEIAKAAREGGRILREDSGKER